MNTALDMAAFILREIPGCNALTLQKLLYYTQGWCLVETGRACFPEPIEAWKNGPVVRAVWAAHRNGSAAERGNADAVAADHASIARGIIEVYGALRPMELVENTHAEPAWLMARRGLEPNERSSQPIDLAVVRAFFERSVEGTRQERMRDALARARERAQLRQVLKPHRATMLHLAQ